MNVNFGLTSEDYTRHRAGFPDAFFEKVFEAGIVRTGNSLVDLGTGTGSLARGFALRGCTVIGLDISAQLLEQARDLNEREGLAIDFRFAKAEATGLPDDSADVVSAGQCWHWFDRPAAAGEVMRILKPGGRTLIAHFDWLPLKDNIVDATEKLIRKYNPKWYEAYANGSGLHPQWLRDLGEAGFLDIQSFSFDLNVPYSPDAWRGRIRASAGVGASLPDQDVGRLDSELKSMLAEDGQTRVGQEPGPRSVLNIPHRIFIVHARKAG